MEEFMCNTCGVERSGSLVRSPVCVLRTVSQKHRSNCHTLANNCAGRVKGGMTQKSREPSQHLQNDERMTRKGEPQSVTEEQPRLDEQEKQPNGEHFRQH